MRKAHDKPVLATITAEKMAGYRAGARRRRRERAQRTDDRREQAWALAHECALLLKDRFAATRVVLFGSLPTQDRFCLESDVDLAAWGVEPGLYLRAVSSVLALDPEISVDLVRAEDAKAALMAAINREGIEL